jgi:glycosyltransferase involved in cell wall biosynthesis
MQLSIVVPAYNESAGIQYFLSELKKVLDSLGISYEVIIVNDGSSDGTREKILEFGWREIHLINLASNAGHMAALEAGLSRSRGAVVVTMDADLQHPPELIRQMIELQYEKKCDVVIATRIRGTETSRVRREFSSAFYKLMSRISKIEIHQDAADFRLMTREVVGILNALPETAKVYRFLISAIGFQVANINYQSSKRAYGISKYSGKQLWRLGVNSIIGFSTFPLSAIFVGGFLVFFLSLIYLFFILLSLGNARQVPGWTSVMTAILVLSSVQIISIGIIGRYISQILSDIRRRPNYVIKGEDNV